MSLCVQISSSEVNTSQAELGPTCMASFHLNYLAQVPIYKYCPILSYLVIELWTKTYSHNLKVESHFSGGDV